MQVNYSYILLFFFGILFFPKQLIAQEIQGPTDDLGNVSDAFQENFFEALKQKGIENYELALEALKKAEEAAKEDPDTKMQMLVDMPQAGLVIGFIDADTGYLIWVGVAEGDAVADRDLDDTRQRLEYAVKKMFKQIP